MADKDGADSGDQGEPKHESKDNVVSLERLRARRRRAAPTATEAASAADGGVRRADSHTDGAEADNSPASAPAAAIADALAAQGAPAGASAEPAERPAPQPGRLAWLHCPTCGTLEYTELLVPGGRRHKCGSIVEEAVVEIDLRAEITLAEINLQRIAALGEYLEQQRQLFQEYQRRLALIGGAPPAPYPLSEEIVKALPVAEVDPLGLLISHALHNPARRFGKKT